MTQPTFSHQPEAAMLLVTYTVYAPTLKRWFRDTLAFRTVADAELYLCAVAPGMYQIVDVQPA